MLRAVLFVFLCVLVGCGGTTVDPDAGQRDDAGPRDSGRDPAARDAATPGPEDSGAASADDAGPPDAGCTGATGTPETYCNALDDDCDGAFDEGFVNEAGVVVVIGAPCDGPDEGACGADGTTLDPNPGVWTCPLAAGGAASCSEPDGDDVEVCDGAAADEDCDGQVDEFALEDGTIVHLGDPCVQGGEALDDAPGCAGVYVCDSTAGLRCEASTPPAAVELCDGDDNDCDGFIDEETMISDAAVAMACADTPCGETVAMCSAGAILCSAGAAPTPYYRDEDGDGYGAGSPMSACSPPSAQWVTVSGDCCDDDGDAHPGAGAQGRATNCGGYDFNCNGVEEKVRVESGVAVNQCYRSACDGGFRRGWDGAVCGYGCNVPCGQQCAYVDGDAWLCTATSTVNKRQECR